MCLLVSACACVCLRVACLRVFFSCVLPFRLPLMPLAPPLPLAQVAKLEVMVRGLFHEHASDVRIELIHGSVTAVLVDGRGGSKQFGRPRKRVHSAAGDPRGDQKQPNPPLSQRTAEHKDVPLASIEGDGFDYTFSDLPGPNLALGKMANQVGKTRRRKSSGCIRLAWLCVCTLCARSRFDVGAVHTRHLLHTHIHTRTHARTHTRRRRVPLCTAEWLARPSTATRAGTSQTTRSPTPPAMLAILTSRPR